jgi:hypothetical protein
MPYELVNAVGSWPDADKYMANWHWVYAMAKGNFLKGPGFEQWDTTSFTNPANAASLSLGWTLEKGGTSSVTADISREATIVDTGGYGMKVNLTAPGSSDSYERIKQTLDNPTRFAGQTLIFGMKVRTATANRVRLSITDGVSTAYSSYQTGGGTFEKLTVALACSQSASAITVKVEITSDFSSDAVYIDSGFVYTIESSMSQTARDALVYFRPDDPLTLLVSTLSIFGALNESQGADIASASTINLDTATGNLVDVTGTTTITAITLSQGRERVVRFTGALTITNGASLVLPGAANITTAAGDFAVFRGYASGVVRCTSYLRANGYPVVNPSPTIQKFTSGSGTYTTPSGVKYIRVRLVGGGGGGGGGGTSGGGTGGTGGSTTFGSSLLSGSGGVGGTTGATAGGAGGAASLGTGPVGLALAGGQGGGSGFSIGTIYSWAGGGGMGPFGGAPPSSIAGAAGTAGETNTGAGGSGGGTTNTNNATPGSGGGAGGYVDAIISSPSATYAYAVGAAGTAGSAGTNGAAGGAGGSGFIIVEEYYV